MAGKVTTREHPPEYLGNTYNAAFDKYLEEARSVAVKNNPDAQKQEDNLKACKLSGEHDQDAAIKELGVKEEGRKWVWLKRAYGSRSDRMYKKDQTQEPQGFDALKSEFGKLLRSGDIEAPHYKLHSNSKDFYSLFNKAVGLATQNNEAAAAEYAALKKCNPATVRLKERLLEAFREAVIKDRGYPDVGYPDVGKIEGAEHIQKALENHFTGQSRR